MGRCWPLACAVVLASKGVSALSALSDTVPGTIHTIFSTECNRYFDWCVTRLDPQGDRRVPCL
jgi:hypothetical protein